MTSKAHAGADGLLGTRSRGEITLTDTDRKAAVLLVELVSVRYPSTFGDLMVRRGVIRSQPGMHYRRQALALLGSKALVRLRRLGLAKNGLYGYLPTDEAKRLAEGAPAQ